METTATILDPHTFDPELILLGYLVRHGELKNMAVWDGWGDLELSAEGHAQAQHAAWWLSFLPIGRVVCSDVPRTRQTAEYIMNTGVVACPYLACDPNLRPWNVSDYTGKEKTPARLASFKQYLDNPDLMVPGGESRNQLWDRIQCIFQYLAAPYEGKITVCVIHNSVIKSLMGLDDMREAVSPGGLIAVYMSQKGEIFYQIVLGAVTPEVGIS